MRKALGAWAAFASLLAACQAEPPAAEPERKAIRRPPQPACEQAQRDLSRRERDGEFLFEENGEAMVGGRSWMRLDESYRNEIIETLAVVAACNAEVPQPEVEVVIRDEVGVVLKSAQVEPRTDYRAR